MTQNNLESDVARVQTRIRQAFAGLPVPAPATLLRSGLPERWRASYEEAHRHFAGRSWDDVKAPFLWGNEAENKPIHMYCYLSAPAFQYYLPPALLACLDDLQDQGPHFYSVMGSLLAPSAARLCAEGVDRNLEERRAAFTNEQNQAVCSFLELIFDHLPKFRWTSARALRWGWDHVGGSGVEKVRAFHHTLQNYHYPLPAEPKLSSLVQEIRAAFADRPYPGDDQLVLSGCGEEPWEYALAFRGTEWPKLHPEFLAAHATSLCFFSEAAFRYFLPAYMQANLCHPDLVEDVVFHLTHGLTDADVRVWEQLEERLSVSSPELRESFATSKAMFDEFRKKTAHIDWKSRAEARFGDFTQAERQATLHYLQYHQLQAQGINGEMIDEALKNYWCPPQHSPEETS